MLPRGSGRLELAKWVSSPTNPLTARVMVNRLWGELFGTGIVATAEDFGTSGTPPTHPELLDHLALRFENDFKWSVKSMLREIVLSATYRQESTIDPTRADQDPENEWLGRGPSVVVTDLGIYHFDDGEMRLDSLHPGATLDEARATIGWDLRTATTIETTPPPTDEELRLIREELDPGGAYTR